MRVSSIAPSGLLISQHALLQPQVGEWGVSVLPWSLEGLLLYFWKLLCWDADIRVDYKYYRVIWHAYAWRWYNLVDQNDQNQKKPYCQVCLYTWRFVLVKESSTAQTEWLRQDSGSKKNKNVNWPWVLFLRNACTGKIFESDWSLFGYILCITTSPFYQFKCLFANYILRDGRGQGIKRRKGEMELWNHVILVSLRYCYSFINILILYLYILK